MTATAAPEVTASGCATCESTLAGDCRVCGTPTPVPVLCRGRVPLANALADSDARHPLHLVMCRACGAVQVADVVDPATVFAAGYPYRTAANAPMVAHTAKLAGRITAEWALGPHDLVLEVGSNDGTMLRHYAAAGVPVLGVDAAHDVAAEATESGVPTRHAHFGYDLATGLACEGVRPLVVHALNVLAHIPDVTDALRGIALLLKSGGVCVVETPYLVDTVERVAFDGLYHEHCYCWSLTAFVRAARRAGLTVVDVERLPDLHCGSLRLWCTRAGEGWPSSSVRSLLRTEDDWGVATPDFLAGFGARVDAVTRRIAAALAPYRERGARIAGYGAAAKGVMLATALGLGADDLAYVVDSTPAKQGLRMPGVGAPIVPPSSLLTDPVDLVLVFAWNWSDSILRAEAEVRRRGTAFLVPLPEPALYAAVGSAA